MTLFDHSCRYLPHGPCLACQAEREEHLLTRTLQRQGAEFVQLQIDKGLLAPGTLELCNDSILRLAGAAIQHGRETERAATAPALKASDCPITSRFAGIDV